MSDTVIEVKGIKWKEYNGALLPDAPPHKTYDFTEQDVKDILKSSGAYFLRWISKFDQYEYSEFWYVIKDTPTSMNELSGNTRSKIRRGFKNCAVKKIDYSYMYENAYVVYKSAFDRYNKILKPLSREEFQEGLRNKNSSKWEFWGVFDKYNKLIGYSENKTEDGSCSYVTVKFDPEGLKLYSSYCLFYEMNHYYLNELSVKYVCDGARSIYHETNIQEYLVSKFKFRKAYARLHVGYRRDIKLLVTMLYPFRSIIENFNNKYASKISALLVQEMMRRHSELQ